jgi:hypothetical protein
MRTKIITQSPSGRNRVNWVDSSVAWHAAQGIAQGSHHAVILYGAHGVVHFDRQGGGVVTWNDNSTVPGTQTRFGPDTTVCVQREGA